MFARGDLYAGCTGENRTINLSINSTKARHYTTGPLTAHGLYLARAVKILSPLTAGCESTLHEREPASGYNVLLTTCCWAQEKCSDDLHHKLIKSNMIRIHHDLLICATFMSFVIMHNTLINFILT